GAGGRRPWFRHSPFRCDRPSRGCRTGRADQGVPGDRGSGPGRPGHGTAELLQLRRDLRRGHLNTTSALDGQRAGAEAPARTDVLKRVSNSERIDSVHIWLTALRATQKTTPRWSKSSGGNTTSNS